MLTTNDIRDPSIALLTIDEVAAYLKMNTRTIHRMIKEGRLVAHKIGHSWRIRQDDLLRCAFANSSRPMEPEDLEKATVIPNHIRAVK
jgi:excisionase family DNA binding protein